MNIWLKKYYRYDVQKLLIGIDGIRFFETIGGKYVKLSLLSGEKTISASGGADLQSNNKQHGVEVSETGVKVKGATYMPGVLLAGDGNAGGGGGTIPFEAKNHATLVVEKLTGNGHYRVWHSVGHKDYTVQLTLKTAGLTAIASLPGCFCTFFVLFVFAVIDPRSLNNFISYFSHLSSQEKKVRCQRIPF